MRQIFGMSRNGVLAEAVSGISRPQFLMLLSNNQQFETHVKELEKLYPGVPSIGCIGMSYDTRIVESGVGVIAFLDGVTAAANVLEEVSVMPVKYISRLEADIQKVNGSERDTVCIDFCTGNDACVLTTIHTALKRNKISLVGGTGDAGKVSANGKIYQDAVAYAIVRNLGGRVKTYKENIYHQHGNYRSMRKSFMLPTSKFSPRPSKILLEKSTATILVLFPLKRFRAILWHVSVR